MTLSKLIEKILEYDQEAARYVYHDAPTLASYTEQHEDDEELELFSLFNWRHTPQGYAYWKNINKLIKD